MEIKRAQIACMFVTHVQPIDIRRLGFHTLSPAKRQNR